MSRVLRFSPSRLGLGYIALSVLALALFAVPLWFAWQTNQSTFKAYVHGEDVQRLVDAFEREGPSGLAAAMDAEATRLPRGEIMVFADAAKQRLAGNLPVWPSEVPDAPGAYGLVIGLGAGASMRVVVSHMRLPGGYHLLLGRESVLFQSFIERFWYGIASAMALVLLLGVAIGWLIRRALLAEVREISDTASAIAKGDLSRRLAPRGGSPALGALARTVNDMLAQLASQNVQLEAEVAVRRQAEQALHRAHDELEGVVAQRTAELARANESLRLSEERYARALEASNDGIWEWNSATDEMFMSARARELWEVPGGAAVRTRAELKKVGGFHPEDLQRTEDAVAANRAPGGPGFDIEYRVITPGGEVRWVRSQGKAFSRVDGGPAMLTGSLTDITERKLASDALRASEERYSLAMEASEEGYVYVDLDTGDFVTSERLNEIFEIAPGTRLSGRRDFLSQFRFYGNDGEIYQQAIRAIEADRGTDRYQFEFRIVLPSGEVRWIWTRGKVTRDPEGRPRRRVGVFSDITARKLAEEALRASEERYSLAMEASEEAHFDVNIDTDELFSSERLNEIYGFPAGTRILKRSEYLKDFGFYGNDAEIYHAGIRAAEAKGGPERYEFEYRIRRSSGEVRWLRTRGKVTRDAEGRARRRTGMVADITEAKLAAEALRASEERFRALAESALAGIYLIQESRFRYVNPAMATMFGYTPEELVDRLGPADLVHPDDRALVAGNIRRRVEGKVDEIRYEFRGVRRDGSVFPVEVHGRRIEFGGTPGVMGTLVDNTERKRAVDELRESEARFRVLTGLSSDWYWEQDENLCFTYLSNQVDDLTGYSGESSLGKTRWEIAHMTPLSCSWTEHQAVLAARHPFRDFECRRVGPDGTMRYLSMSGAPIFDAQGRFKGYQGIGRNITERKRIEDALRLSEARYARAMEATEEGHWEWDVVTDDIFVSGRVNRMFGYPEDARFDKRADFVANAPYHPDDREHIAASIRAGLSGTSDRHDFEYRIVLPPGRERWIRARWKILRDPSSAPLRVTGALVDITDRKRAEEELRARQDMLDLAQKAARAVAFEWWIGVGEGQNRWSPDLEAMYGLEPGSYDGSYETWKKLVFPEDWPAVKAAIKRANETGDVAAEYRVMHPDGAVRWLQAKGRMFFDAEHKATRMVGFMLDVTDRRQAEEELRRLERQLRQAQRLEAMGALAGGIAHDFNNILGAILGYGEMALREVSKGSRLRRDLDSIMTAGERGRSLVERILAFSRSGIGERRAVHVEQIAGEALDQLAAKLPADITLAPRLHAGRAAVLGDPTQIHQVLMNLAINAIQAMSSGGTLHVRLDPARVDAARVATVGSLGAGDYVVLQVADSGVGMPPEVLERIFDPFFTTKEVGVGTGLGLSLVHGIVTELGGAIDVSSTVGRGSTFTVYLPRAGDAAHDQEQEQPEPPRGNRQQVLIVDDEAPLVTLATETLAELGYVPSGFTSSAAALAAFCADPARFDAVITDERMPGMSGSALIREIRKVRRTIPILLVSGYAGGAVVRRAIESGADEVLKKPLSARDLAATLARVLDARSLEAR